MYSELFKRYSNDFRCSEITKNRAEEEPLHEKKHIDEAKMIQRNEQKFVLITST